MFALLREQQDTADSNPGKKAWNEKFSWFTHQECNRITTIHGEKDSMSNTCGGFPQKRRGF